MLTLCLLGRPALRGAAGPVPLTIRKTWALLVVLAVAGPTRRGGITERLWPGLDAAAAKRNLRRELARLREAGAAELVRVDGEFLALAGAADCDLHRFDLALNRGLHDDALALWRGPLADGLQLDDAPEFDEWLAGERERMRGRWRSALEGVAARSE